MRVRDKRKWFQGLSALGFNFYLPAFLKGEIFQGGTKGVCVPVLNCYSCPSAVGACPIGALQNAFGSIRFKLSVAEFQFGLYVLGFLGAVGSLVGRIPCGWLCPFGLIQELLYKIPAPKLRIPKFLSSLKYLILALMVFALPLLIADEFGYGQTWFCKWICPAGTLEAGLPLVLLNAGIRTQIGFMFFWKVGLLVFFLAWMVVSQRPFCRTTCPLGALFGLFNKASLFRMVVDDEKCTRCDKCVRDCPVGVKVYETPNSPNCIRCLKCVDSCNYGYIGYEFLSKKPKRETESAS
jgi:ferredoxin-type protein NapH